MRTVGSAEKRNMILFLEQPTALELEVSVRLWYSPLAVYEGSLRISDPAFLNGTAAVMRRSWINWRPSGFLEMVN